MWGWSPLLYFENVPELKHWIKANLIGHDLRSAVKPLKTSSPATTWNLDKRWRCLWGNGSPPGSRVLPACCPAYSACSQSPLPGYLLFIQSKISSEVTYLMPGHLVNPRMLAEEGGIPMTFRLFWHFLVSVLKCIWWRICHLHLLLPSRRPCVARILLPRHTLCWLGAGQSVAQRCKQLFREANTEEQEAPSPEDT